MNKIICLKLKKSHVVLLQINKQFTFETCKISKLHNTQWQAIPLLRCTVFT